MNPLWIGLILKRNFNMIKPLITTFDNSLHREQVVSLWKKVFNYQDTRNKPELAIDKKLAVKDNLFLVALDDDNLIATIMSGYDGHRGWIYSLAVLPEYQKQGIGSALLAFAEEKLLELGCVKINLQIMADNDAVEQFYLANGYRTEPRISMGKSLI